MQEFSHIAFDPVLFESLHIYLYWLSHIPLLIMDFWGDLFGSPGISISGDPCKFPQICRNLQGSPEGIYRYLLGCLRIHVYRDHRDWPTVKENNILIYIYTWREGGRKAKKKTTFDPPSRLCTREQSGDVRTGTPFLVGRSSRTV